MYLCVFEEKSKRICYSSSSVCSIIGSTHHMKYHSTYGRVTCSIYIHYVYLYLFKEKSERI